MSKRDITNQTDRIRTETVEIQERKSVMADSEQIDTANKTPKTDPKALNHDHDHPLFAAIYDRCMWGFEATILPKHRERLSRDLSGRVLDIGSGTGVMFPYYREAIDDGADIDLHGIEPDSYMRRRAQRTATDLDLAIDLRGAPAEELPYSDESFDVVVAALVFCTIGDPEAALNEIARVLRPGGEFRSFEHVADDGWRQRVQTAVTPIWKRAVFTGCHLDRDTPALFASHDGFDIVELDRGHEFVTPLRVMTRSVLQRRSASGHEDDHQNRGAEL